MQMQNWKMACEVDVSGCSVLHSSCWVDMLICADYVATLERFIIENIIDHVPHTSH